MQNTLQTFTNSKLRKVSFKMGRVEVEQSFHNHIQKNAKSISAIDQIDKKSAIATWQKSPSF